MTSAVFHVSALTWEGYETVPVSTSPLGAVDESQKLMDSGDYRAVFIKDDEGQIVTRWTLQAGEWIPSQGVTP